MAVAALVLAAAAPFGVAIARPASATDSSAVVERTWVRLNIGHPPANGVMAYDPVRHQTVLFVPAGAGSQTWVFSGAHLSWTIRTPATTPPLTHAAGAFDAARKVLVIVGYRQGSTAEETWTWNGTDWMQLHPATTPDMCLIDQRTSAVYDAAHGQLLVFPFDCDSPLEGSVEQWRWDGTDWHKDGAHYPDGMGAALAYDPNTRGVLAFGGEFLHYGVSFSGDTSAWNGNAWNPLRHFVAPTDDPRPRAVAAMTFDSTLGAPVLFGGTGYVNGVDIGLLNDTWWWAGTHWVRLGTRSSPPPMESKSFVYDVDHHFGVLFGGANETWLFTAATAGNGYLMAERDGTVLTFGDAEGFGDARTLRLTEPIVGIARTGTRKGYWLTAADGGVFAFGDARFHGSTGNLRLNQPIVGIAPTPSGLGYWLVASDGGIFAFGDAHYHGSTGNIRLNRPIVGMAATRTGDGYWLVASDGGIFAFGDARFHGGTGNMRLNQPVTGMAVSPRGGGYWLVARDGGIFTFGNLPFAGARLTTTPVVAIAPSPTGAGYWTFDAAGQVGAFGDARPHGNATPAQRFSPVVGATVT